MRFQGSLYDNLRQPGVFGELEKWILGPWDRENRLKAALLARLRLDDLLCNDDLADDVLSKPSLVASISDIVDGRLFTLLAPHDLDGIDLEILCPQRLKDEPTSAVLRTVRSWIQNEDGTGRPAFFMACPGGSTRLDIAHALQSMSGLNVTSLHQARLILESAGMEGQIADQLERYWHDWQDAIGRHDHRLSAYPGPPASAVPSLRRRLKGLERQPEEFGLTETGVHAFAEALRVLEDNNGRRDATTAMFEHYVTSSSGTDRDEFTAVRQIFYHHMFEAIAIANLARPEHSMSIGGEDAVALPEHYFIRLERFEDSLERVYLDSRIVVALGGMSAADYKEAKLRAKSSIAIGVREFRRSAAERGTGDLTKLSGALDSLAQRLASTEALPGVGALFRRYVIDPAVIGGGVAAFNVLVGSPPETVRTAGEIAAAGSVLKSALEDVSRATMVHRLLLKRSLVKAAKEELNSGDR